MDSHTGYILYFSFPSNGKGLVIIFSPDSLLAWMIFHPQVFLRRLLLSLKVFHLGHGTLRYGLLQELRQLPPEERPR